MEQAIRGARILWVDDTPSNNGWERLMLRELGAEVTAVSGNAAAVDCLKAERFDVVLSDIARAEGLAKTRRHPGNQVDRTRDGRRLLRGIA